MLSTARLKAARELPKRLYMSHPWCKCADPNQRGLRKIMLDHEQFANRMTPMTQDLNTISSVIGATTKFLMPIQSPKIDPIFAL